MGIGKWRAREVSTVGDADHRAVTADGKVCLALLNGDVLVLAGNAPGHLVDVALHHLDRVVAYCFFRTGYRIVFSPAFIAEHHRVV